MVPGMEPYRVPFVFERERAPRYRLVNVGAEQLRGVSLYLRGPGVMTAVPTRPLAPGEGVEIMVRGDDLGRDTSVFVAWLRPNGDDYLWRVVF